MIDKSNNKKFDLEKLLKERDEKTLVLRFRNFVYRIYIDNFSNYSDISDDLIQEGMIGLIKAIRYYDIEKDTKFTTYAYKCILLQMSRFAKKQRAIRLPNNLVNIIKIAESSKWEFFKKYERFPSLEELSQITNISLDKINEASLYEKSLLSLEFNKNDELDPYLLEDTVKDETINVEDDYIEKDTTNNINIKLYKLINLLPKKYKVFLLIRFGFYDNNKHSLDETANILYKLKITDTILTRERLRQYEKRILNAFRDQNVLNYLDNERKTNIEYTSINSNLRKILINSLEEEN